MGVARLVNGAIEWGIRDTLMSYLARAADFAVECVGGASFDPVVGVSIPATVEPDGRARATGAVSLQAHGGALSLPLRGLDVDGEVLWIDDPVEGAPARQRLMLLAPAVSDEPGVDRYETRLSPEADALFLYNYVPEVSFAPLRVRRAG